ncbi:MAG TPA: RecQ family ATP-dependent DNA helicase, partial [Candidatus Elarobacter sp.]|nr:RecQ family ATP-dependent DNA helicase [Candidatus Elarobacter sp.]
FGYPEFRAGQTAAVESVLAARDTLVILPTGGGKSLCYQVPALLLPGLTVVVSPLISLMKDQVDALVARGVPAAFVNSTLTSGQVSDRMARAASGELKLLYLAPERFDFPNTAQQLRRAGVSLLAIDEAHCISQWGHDFRPSYLRMRAVREALGDPPTVALTATATPAVRRDIARQLALRDPKVVITGFDRTNLTYSVLPARNDAEKDRSLVDVLAKRDGLAVVYAATRRAVERLGELLLREGIPAAAYHAGLDDSHRHDVQEAFMSERVRVIVATNAFGMGIDKPNVRLVVHHSMPGTLEAYYQEAGRAGRDGLPSDAILLHAFPDRFTHEFFIKGAYPERDVVARVYAALQRRADRTGTVSETPEELAGAVSGKMSARDVESSLRVLEQGGAIAKAAESGSLAHVRLLATPARITRELDAGAMEIHILRALWRAAGAALHDGAIVDLGSLPSGLGSPAELHDALEHLEQRQFVTVASVGGGIALSAPSRALDTFPIDWASLDARRELELDKLNSVQRYAYTPGCRRGFVLRYFGDPAARDHCEGCDNCLGTAAPRPKRGADDGPPRARTRGNGASNAAGNAAGAGAKSRVRERPADPAIEDLPPDALERFERLRALRREIAREEQVPAYIVFDDKTLRRIAVHRPRTLAALG